MLKRFLTRKGREENRLIKEALKTGDTTTLAEFIISNGRFPTRLLSDQRYSVSGRISYEMSPFGSIVKIDNGDLLDVRPDYYGFSKEMGREILYEAILNAQGSSRKKEFGMGILN